MNSIEEVFSNLPDGDSLHAQLAKKVLTKLGYELDQLKIYWRVDKTWPYHIIARDEFDNLYSLWCGGFDKGIEIAPLSKDGKVDKRWEEKRFMTPKGAANSLSRVIKKRKG